MAGATQVGIRAALVGALAALGCGSNLPSDELVSARRAYGEAEQSKAPDLVPAQLLTAKQALDQAEKAHRDSARSMEERTLAYVAERQALQAIAAANMQAAQAELEEAERRYRDELEVAQRHTRNRLADTKDSLGRTEDELAKVREELSREKDALSEKAKALQQRERELEEERQRREEAEKKAAAAMSSLEKFARIHETPRGLVITLSGGVLFQTNRADLLPRARDQLERVAHALLAQDETKTILVEGHTDSRGAARKNQTLSQQRAEAVRIFLISSGVPAGRIVAVGKGSSEPVADNRSPEGRANNRRVEIILQNR